MPKHLFFLLILFNSTLILLTSSGCSSSNLVKLSHDKQIKSVKTDRGLLLILEAVYFEFNSADINPSAHSIIDEVIDIIGDYPNSHIAIDGYTDNTGTERYNQHLSTERAQSVKTALVERGGIQDDRITVQGFGPTNPIADNTSPQGRQRNRRVEILILKPIDIPTEKE